MSVAKKRLISLAFLLLELPGVAVLIYIWFINSSAFLKVADALIWCAAIVPGILTFAVLIFSRKKSRWLIPVCCAGICICAFGVVHFAVDVMPYRFPELIETVNNSYFPGLPVATGVCILAIIATQVLVHYFCKSLPKKAPQE